MSAQLSTRVPHKNFVPAFISPEYSHQTRELVFQSRYSQRKQNVFIRQAGFSDASTLAELGARTFVETYAKDMPLHDLHAYTAKAFDIKHQVAELAKPDARYLIASIHEMPCGYTKLQPNHAPDAIQGLYPIQLDRLYADSAWIGQGVGSALMESGLEMAGNAGHDSIWLRVYDKNHLAIQFYKRWGFRIAGKDPDPYTIGNTQIGILLMARFL